MKNLSILRPKCFHFYFSFAADSQEMQFEIIHVDTFSSLRWKIPCFPVMTLEFAKIHFKSGTEIEDGVVQKSMASDLKRGKYMCTSHCQIEIDGEKYTVLWKLNQTENVDLPPVPPSTVADNLGSDDDDSDNDDNNEPDESVVVTSHCLPFKVMGTCYSEQRQRALLEAYEYLYEHNRPVFAKLEADPENAYDRNAIAVYIMSYSGFNKVGYLARELTQFIHPLLNDPSLRVSVKKIRFSTSYQMMGFYLTIDITRRGLWDKPVIQASRKAK